MNVTAYALHEEVEVPLQRLRVQTEPVAYEDALAAAVDGRYRGVLAVPVHAVFGTAPTSVVQRFLARSLVVAAPGAEVDYAPVAFGDGGATVYVEVSLSVGGR